MGDKRAEKIGDVRNQLAERTRSIDLPLSRRGALDHNERRG